jgi:hypothetical protein
MQPPSNDAQVTATNGQQLDSVVIELSSAQVDRVVGAASPGGAISTLLVGLGGIRAKLSPDGDAQRPSQFESHRLSGSLLSGLFVLSCLPADGSQITLSKLAHVTGMTISTTHRYVNTLLSVGLVERDPRTRGYKLLHAPAARDRLDSE